jgi:hypothetical protein
VFSINLIRCATEQYALCDARHPRGYHPLFPEPIMSRGSLLGDVPWRKSLEEFRDVKVLRLYHGREMEVADMLRKSIANSLPAQEEMKPDATMPLGPPMNTVTPGGRHPSRVIARTPGGRAGICHKRTVGHPARVRESGPSESFVLSSSSLLRASGMALTTPAESPLQQ